MRKSMAEAPGWRVVAVEQLRAVGYGIRWEAMFVLALLGAFTANILTSYWRHGHSNDVIPILALPMVVVGALLPLVVWKEDGPERRTYLWSLPVGKATHQLVKLGAGWTWLMVAVGLYLLWAMGMAIVTGGEIGQATVLAIRDGSGSWQTHTRSTPGWQWAVPFVAATTAYLFGSIPTLSSNHPIRWYGAALMAVVFLGAVGHEMEFAGVRSLYQAVFGDDSGYGLKTALTGEILVQEVVSGFGDSPRWFRRPELDYWVSATTVWFGSGLAGALVAATRRHS